jgi:hypothetical protein
MRESLPTLPTGRQAAGRAVGATPNPAASLNCTFHESIRRNREKYARQQMKSDENNSFSTFISLSSCNDET